MNHTTTNNTLTPTRPRLASLGVGVLACLFLFTPLANAQLFGSVIKVYTSDPTGIACARSTLAVDQTTGQGYYCDSNGQWAALAGGGGGGSINTVNGTSGRITASTVGDTVTLDLGANAVTTDGDPVFTGQIDMSGAAKTAPFQIGAADPATCDNTITEWFFNTTSGVLKYCSAANTWTAYSSTPPAASYVTDSVATGSVVTNSTSMTTLLTSTLDAGELAVGDMVRIIAVYSHAGGTAVAPRVQIEFGATAIISDFVMNAADTTMRLEADILISGSSAQHSSARTVRTNGTDSTLLSATPAEAISGAINILFRGRMASATAETVECVWYSVIVQKKR